MENKLERATRRVAESRKVIADQEALIERLKAKGLPTQGAEVALDMFKRSLASFEDHLKALTSKRTGGQL